MKCYKFSKKVSSDLWHTCINVKTTTAVLITWQILVRHQAIVLKHSINILVMSKVHKKLVVQYIKQDLI